MPAGRQPFSGPRPGGSLPRRGRILRIKWGYNPNSSSMGSIVFGLKGILVTVTGLFGLAAGILYAVFGDKGSPPRSDDEKHHGGEQ